MNYCAIAFNKFTRLIDSAVMASVCLLLIGIVSAKNCHAEAYAYIPNSDTGTISVYRTYDNTFIDEITVGNEPYGTAISRDGAYVYVTNKADGTVSVIDTLDGEITDTIQVGNDPTGIAVAPSGDYVYVANNGDGTVSVIKVDADDDDHHAVTATIAVGQGPSGVAVDPSERYVYVANNLDHTVSVFSLDSDPVAVDVGQGPVGITSDPIRSYIYVTNNLDGTVSVIDINGENRGTDEDDGDYDDDNLVIATVAVGEGPWGLAVADNGATVYVGNSLENTVSVINVSDFTVSSTVDVGENPLGISVVQNGNRVYVLNHMDEHVSIIDTETNQVSALDMGDVLALYGMGNFIGGTPPEAVSDLGAGAASDSSIELVWTDNSYGELGFKILSRKASDEGPYELIAMVGSNVDEYTDTGLSSGTTYDYIVAAYNEAADSYYTYVSATTSEDDDGLLGIGGSSGCFIDSAGFTSCENIQVWIVSVLLFGISLFIGGGIIIGRYVK